MKLVVSIYHVGGGKLISEVVIRREFIAISDIMPLVYDELETIDIANYHLEIVYDTKER